MKRFVIGILAHVDAGKTTLSEALLYGAGALRTPGRVDHGDSFLDTRAVERARGITVFAKQAVLRPDGAEITLIDTPGHVDFAAETERAIPALDCAVLVVSGTDGVQSHTGTLWRLLAQYRTPVFLFVNKMDQPGADRAAVLRALAAGLSGRIVDCGPGLPEPALQENFASADEALLARYLEAGALTDAEICEAVLCRKAFPCLFGSALRLEGTDALLALLARFMRTRGDRQAPFAGRVFKVTNDRQAGRLTHIKVEQGTLRVRDQLAGAGRDGKPWQEKVGRLLLFSGDRGTPVDAALPGMAVAAAGLSETWPGEGLGALADLRAPLLEPVLLYRADFPPEVDPHTALAALRSLEEEDPLLRVDWQERLGEIQVRLMGEVQLEILRGELERRFGLTASFAPAGVAYKETIAAPVDGAGHFEPLRHYAEVHLRLEPLPRGSGLQFESALRADELDKNWQNLILTHLAEKPHRGALTGSPVTDIRMTLVAGRAHLKHTEGGDFREATYRAVRQGLRSAQSILLEPVYTFRLELPQENVGRALADIQRMNGAFEPPQAAGETAVVTGRAPAAAMRAYGLEVARYTRGRGRLSCTVAGYAECADAPEVIARIGYDPDADVENTADSVFCAHGAGEVVPWREAPARMHIQLRTVQQPPAGEPDAAQAEERRAAAYRSSLEEDAELLRIFERTYGPIRQNRRAALQSPPRRPLPRQEFAGVKTDYLLVDGYNIIFAWEELRALAAEDLDAARGRLLDRMANYQGYVRCELIVVFDAYRVRGAVREVERLHNISVVYTKEAETADMYIEKTARALAKNRRVRVATSDGLEQLIILGQGASRVSAEMFHEEVERVEGLIREIVEQLNDGM